jgi:hypothetical protein
MENGDVEKLVPQFCEITHRRAFALQGEACGHRADASCCLGEASGRPVPSAEPAPVPLLQIQRRPKNRPAA